VTARASLNVICPGVRAVLEKAFTDRGWEIEPGPGGSGAGCLVIDPGFTCAEDGGQPGHVLPAEAAAAVGATVQDYVRARGAAAGSVVLLSSRDALGTPDDPLRAAMAAAVIALGRSLALTHAPAAVTVNTVVGPSRPGSASPAGTARAFNPVALLPEQPSAGDVASAVAFFADARSNYITGQTLFVCGGADLLSSPSA
jgi:NAD(P)-dependent dehydrogenase (short-subunit alcohol dehydrogenase family)